IPIPHFVANPWLQLALITPVLFWSGWRILRSAGLGLLHRSADMNVLIAIGTGSSYIFSLANTVAPHLFERAGLLPHVYYETAGVIITLMLFGRMLEARAKARTGGAIEKLIGLQPETA